AVARTAGCCCVGVEAWPPKLGCPPDAHVSSPCHDAQTSRQVQAPGAGRFMPGLRGDSHETSVQGDQMTKSLFRGAAVALAMLTCAPVHSAPVAIRQGEVAALHG